jgi:protein-disulfide isomerase
MDCGPCAKAHPAIEEILANNEDVKVQMIFTANDDEKDIKAKPVKHLMALAEKENAELIHVALDDWYSPEKKDSASAVDRYDVFAAKYSLNGGIQKQGKKLEAMSEWCKEIKIEFTPTFFVNGYQLPEVYKIEDVQNLL